MESKMEEVYLLIGILTRDIQMGQTPLGEFNNYEEAEKSMNDHPFTHQDGYDGYFKIIKVFKPKK